MEQFDTASGRSASTVHYEVEVYPAHTMLSGCSRNCNALAYVSMRAFVRQHHQNMNSSVTPRDLSTGFDQNSVLSNSSAIYRSRYAQFVLGNRPSRAQGEMARF